MLPLAAILFGLVLMAAGFAQFIVASKEPNDDRRLMWFLFGLMLLLIGFLMSSAGSFELLAK